MAAREREPVTLVGQAPAETDSRPYAQRIPQAQLDDEIRALLEERGTYQAKPQDWAPRASRIGDVDEQIRLRGGTVPKGD
jgi:hypothetical protein